MHFGKEFMKHLEDTIPEWRDQFLCYKLLKKLLNSLLNPFHFHERLPNPFHLLVQNWFVQILNLELDKLNDFVVDTEEDLIIRFQELKRRFEVVRDRSNRGGVLTSESEFSQEVMNIRKEFVTIHGETVLLKNYISLNFTGLVKILKKYDKRTGGLLSLHFTQTALRAPFFKTESLTILVHECEANLELLFPLEAEVIEPLNDTPNVAADTPSNQETNMDVYRGTVAAMRAIQGVQRESSTPNRWSLSNHARDREDETGAVTTEDSASSSAAT